MNMFIVNCSWNPKISKNSLQQDDMYQSEVNLLFKCNSQKRINVCKKLIHVLDAENVTYSEYPEIIDHLNDLITAARDDLEYPDYDHWFNKTKAVDANDIAIEEW